MLRRSVLAWAAALAAILGSAAAADAGQLISRNNPYRSFNISGVNYGSVNWERQQRSGPSRSVGRAILFRKR